MFWDFGRKLKKTELLQLLFIHQTKCKSNQVGESMFVIVQSLRRRRDDILDVGESTLDVGELTVGETTRRRNDRLPCELT